ncbi:hypothetical protein GCM10010975_26100 [Comamonas phosphati]|nr:hypothetical protein GCM10010975_26100 [Comamonas phosphati]
MYRNLGMDLHACAQFLHVSSRTVHNWEAGKHDIPYATYKLLRLMNGMELPGQAWAGWEFRCGKLVSPEGFSFVATDGSCAVQRGPMQTRAWWVCAGTLDQPTGGRAAPLRSSALGGVIGLHQFRRQTDGRHIVAPP